jgi:hypothetical protein
MSTPINKFWTVVALHEDGSLTSPPAQKHDTEDKALSEALRLARSITTTAFLVMEPVGGFRTARPAAMPVVIVPPENPAQPEPEDIIDYMEAKAAAEAASPPADDWITWTGGDNPAPGKIVQYRFAGTQQDAYKWKADNLRWDWQYGGTGPDITAYRVVRS